MNDISSLSGDPLRPRLDCKVDLSSVDFNHEKHFPRFRISRRVLLSPKNALIFIIIVGAIVMCYITHGWKMDRESADAMRALDLDVAPIYLGKKTLDRFGRLRRAETSVVCQTVNVEGFTVDYSNHAICMQNADLHANCIRVCDSAFSSCPGCAALAADRANQLAIAQANCDYKAAFTCKLTTKIGGAYDYEALSTCCLQSRPPGPDACMCTHQQSSSATCLLDGVCLGAATCSRKSSLICTGTSKAKPSKYCLTPGALACTGSATKEVDTSCGMAGGTQYYLNSATAKCVISCPAGLKNSIVSGVGVCK